MDWLDIPTGWSGAANQAAWLNQLAASDLCTMGSEYQWWDAYSVWVLLRMRLTGGSTTHA